MAKVMGMSKSILFALLVGLFLKVQIQAQDQSGFISIDCGLPANSNYSEATTGLNYISDAKFIDSGVSKTVPAELQSVYQQQLWSLRSFPEGIRNCYNINITSGSKYLIRANFLYGNYDELNELPEFDLHLGANLWETVTITNASLAIYYEIIHILPLAHIQICLANTGYGTPFIAAIELRLLPNDTYVTNFGSLSFYSRLNLGYTGDGSYRLEINDFSRSLATELRLFQQLTTLEILFGQTYNAYNYDVYDRFWYPNIIISDPNIINITDWTQISASISAGSFVQNHFEPPVIVLSTAATPANASAPLVLSWYPPNVTDQYYVYMHFLELQVLNNETRAFNITLNGNIWYQNLIPEHSATTTLYSRSPTSGKEIEFLLVKTEQSTLPPIINAIEIYSVKEFLQSETDQEDVDAITTIKSSYGVTKNWQGDPCSPMAYLWNGVNCTYDGNAPRITALNLSSSGLIGTIDSSFSKLTMLEELDLSNNSLNGQVPNTLSELQLLKLLNLNNNNLTGSIPSELLQRSKTGALLLSWSQNPYLCESLPCNASSTSSNNNKKNNAVVRIVASVGGVLIFLIAMAAIFWSLKRRKPIVEEKTVVEVINDPYETLMQHNKPDDDSSLESKRRQYSYFEILKITNNFDRILGKGGFGAVYLGSIDNTPVAVKMLSASSVQGYQQFQAEVKLLLRVHHRNLTSLIGYCNEEHYKGLIYEYMANGNLKEHLSIGSNVDSTGKDNKPNFLTWEDRLRIALDAARGLEYLHNGCKPQIIHRDVKSANILLNENFQAKLADFGLSKIIPTEWESHVSTVVAGTPGYLDPEYYLSSRLTEKSDVYSFGVVLLEMITSQAVVTADAEQSHIIQWVSSLLDNGDIKNIVGTRIRGDYDCNSVCKALEISMACVSIKSSRRPTMSKVVTELKDCLATELARRKQTGANAGDSVERVSLNLTTELTHPLAR